MDDKNESEKLMEEMKRIGEGFNKFIESIGEALNKLFYPKEDECKMKFPFENGDEYWILHFDGTRAQEVMESHTLDKSAVLQNNAFKTREDALLEADRRCLLSRFRAFRDECNGDWKVDWSKQDIKYFLSYSQKFDVIYTESICIRERFNLFGYFKNLKDAERAIELFGDEIKELFVEKRLENENN